MTHQTRDLTVGDEVAVRNDKGQFLKGYSGNPVGRPQGIRNQTTLVKDWINNALVNDLQEDALDILAVAVKKAKGGDNAMIKLLLKDLIAATGEDEVDKSDVVIKVKNMTINAESDGITIDQEETTDE